MLLDRCQRRFAGFGQVHNQPRRRNVVSRMVREVALSSTTRMRWPAAPEGTSDAAPAAASGEREVEPEAGPLTLDARDLQSAPINSTVPG